MKGKEWKEVEGKAGLEGGRVRKKCKRRVNGGKKGVKGREKGSE